MELLFEAWFAVIFVARLTGDGDLIGRMTLFADFLSDRMKIANVVLDSVWFLEIRGIVNGCIHEMTCSATPVRAKKAQVGGMGKCSVRAFRSARQLPFLRRGQLVWKLSKPGPMTFPASPRTFVLA